MCDATTKSKIEDACKELVGRKNMFTALDVTKKTWELLSNLSTDNWPKGYHSSIKEYIHDTMRSYVETGIYEKCYWNIGNNLIAMLYFPVGSDPNNYASGMNDDVDVGSNRNRSTLKLDVRGQLHIPCDYLRKAGFAPNDIAYAIQKGNDLSLVKHNSGNQIASYHVDYHCAVRLSRRTISTMWPTTTSSSFSFSSNDGEVLISQS
jgi:hypothetical protein